MTNQINPNLTPEQKKVLFEHGTEAPYTGQFYLNKAEGVFHCANCDNPLFLSATQQESDCGWPSFVSPITPTAVKYETDYSFGMVRTEVLCGRCGAHLGHVFPDGKKQDFCINSSALEIRKK